MQTANSGNRVAKTKRPKSVAAKQNTGERRRLAQLLVSLGLFSLVFFGRGVFPMKFEELSQAIEKDVAFGAVFQTFGQALADEKNTIQALRNLGVSVFGGEPKEEAPLASEAPEPQKEIVPLSQTDRFGLDQMILLGITKDIPTGSPEPVETEVLPPSAAPEPTPQVVTAVAQIYGQDGTKLPSNVSFQYYELGLDKTAIPVIGEVSSGFGYRKSPLNGKREFHLALDIAAEKGTKIGAFADGVVEYIGESDEFGLYLKINHANNVSSFYAHCSKLMVRKGETVACGQTVALVGDTGRATGTHLHLTIEKDNVRLDPAHYVDL